ncbi:diphosphomevalonate decarboxylase [Nocardia terpenica]|uniref:diphosphomevalonate decarboxylase n=1 Tax=Nocardia terpenica TaxID=455432 RepID=UPI002FE164AC
MTTPTTLADNRIRPGAGWLPGASAIAHPNIALIKYWGKRDESLHLPVTDSLSMTLDIFPTVTTVRPDPTLDSDVVVLSDQLATPSVHARVASFLDLVRKRAGTTVHARVNTRNTVPTGAGLASSAAAFAALAVAAAAAYDLDLDRRELSRLARRGSGSACRSIYGGFVVWHAGTDDPSSYAEPVDAPALDPAMVVAIVDEHGKRVSSRDAMRRTVATSPLYPEWARHCATDLDKVRTAIASGDLDTVGRVAESNALGMHAAIAAARPPIRYLSPLTKVVLDRIVGLRRAGTGVYATIDAGPNVVALCSRRDTTAVAQALGRIADQVRVQVALPGPAAYLISEGTARSSAARPGNYSSPVTTPCSSAVPPPTVRGNGGSRPGTTFA